VFRRWVVVLAALVLASAIGFAQDGAAGLAEEYVTVPLVEPPELRSATPHFAQLVAAPYYQTALWLIFDESRGTGSGYDLLYVDFNYDGRIGQGELAHGQGRTAGEVTVVYFPPFGVPAPDGLQQAPGDKPRVQVTFYNVQGRDYVRASSTVRISGASGRPDDSWQYAITGQLRTGPSADQAPLTAFRGEPSLQVVARADAKNRSAIGIGLTAMLGGNACTPRSMQGSPDATIVVRNQAGQIVHQASKSLDTFCFG